MTIVFSQHCPLDGITVHAMEQWVDNLVINETAKHEWLVSCVLDTEGVLTIHIGVLQI